MFEFVVSVIVAAGLIGVALLMFAENVVPPIPSEVIMPLAGFAAARGDLNFAGVVIAGTVGAVAGAYGWYEVGRRIPDRALESWVSRHGRWLTLDEQDLRRARELFRRHGGPAVFVGRLIPAVRTLISVPAGLARMRHATFLAWTTAGTAAWTLLLASAGYLLEAEYRRVERWLDPATGVVLGLVVLLYLYRLVRRSRA
ncbi:DedA family protein [Phenylobacterium sp.]|uniref:DedA family protein n=1 Tax=Phenylobacterium sp. TaxID=1871053 RepID=UPI0028112063|nr:DedA family protein [Phenylobacterium sp.]